MSRSRDPRFAASLKLRSGDPWKRGQIPHRRHPMRLRNEDNPLDEGRPIRSECRVLLFLQVVPFTHFESPSRTAMNSFAVLIL